MVAWKYRRCGLRFKVARSGAPAMVTGMTSRRKFKLAMAPFFVISYFWLTDCKVDRLDERANNVRIILVEPANVTRTDELNYIYGVNPSFGVYG